MQTLDDLKSKIRLLYSYPATREQALKLEDDLRTSYRNGTIPFDVGSLQCDFELDKFITQDLDMLKMKEDVRKLVNLDDPVLIHGESGTGKSIIAKALHGPRKGKFVHVNCTSMPDELIESELFGHKKGSFTGAIADRVGKFQEASGGTIFLDEIGDMPINMQTKLLLAIEEKWICQVGSNEEIPINCRIISATNQDVKTKIRNDLYWRLSVFELSISPLRNRLLDVELIAKSIDPNFPIKDFLNTPRHAEDEYIGLYGNVRQLQRAIKRWKTLSVK